MDVKPPPIAFVTVDPAAMMTLPVLECGGARAQHDGAARERGAAVADERDAAARAGARASDDDGVSADAGNSSGGGSVSRRLSRWRPSRSQRRQISAQQGGATAAARASSAEVMRR